MIPTEHDSFRRHQRAKSWPSLLHRKIFGPKWCSLNIAIHLANTRFTWHKHKIPLGIKNRNKNRIGVAYGMIPPQAVGQLMSRSETLAVDVSRCNHSGSIRCFPGCCAWYVAEHSKVNTVT